MGKDGWFLIIPYRILISRSFPVSDYETTFVISLNEKILNLRPIRFKIVILE